MGDKTGISWSLRADDRFQPDYVARVGDQLLGAIVRSTLKGLDMHVNSNTGEVYSPAPKPSIVFSGVRQSGVHYKGQRRRRGYRR